MHVISTPKGLGTSIQDHGNNIAISKMPFSLMTPYDLAFRLFLIDPSGPLCKILQMTLALKYDPMTLNTKISVICYPYGLTSPSLAQIP